MLYARRSRWLGLALLLVLLPLVPACTGTRSGGPPAALTSEPPGTRPAEVRAIRAVLAADERAGTRRNRAPETAPLSRVIRQYVAALEGLDLDATPPDFAAAFRAHLEAWREAAGTLSVHDDMRGEMHELFERIRGLGPSEREALEEAEAGIWGTWEEVEASARRHGAIPRGER